MTITLQIGNTDNKLTQQEYHQFCCDIGELLVDYIDEVHFSAPSTGWEKWQNACWVGEIKEFMLSGLKEKLSILRKKYNQDSVSITVGQTEFI
jgi:hypothetical protein